LQLNPELPKSWPPPDYSSGLSTKVGTTQDRIRVLIDPTYTPPERDEKKAKGTL
jgi:hypothetical protein